MSTRNPSHTRGELIKRYKATRGTDWTEGYLITFRWAQKQLIEFKDTPLSQLDTQHWQEWLPKWRKAGDSAPKSSNHLRSFLLSVYSMPEAAAVFATNPIKAIPPAKIKIKEISITSVDTPPAHTSKRKYEQTAKTPKQASCKIWGTPWFIPSTSAGR